METSSQQRGNKRSSPEGLSCPSSTQPLAHLSSSEQTLPTSSPTSSQDGLLPSQTYQNITLSPPEPKRPKLTPDMLIHERSVSNHKDDKFNSNNSKDATYYSNYKEDRYNSKKRERGHIQSSTSSSSSSSSSSAPSHSLGDPLDLQRDDISKLREIRKRRAKGIYVDEGELEAFVSSGGHSGGRQFEDLNNTYDSSTNVLLNDDFGTPLEPFSMKEEMDRGEVDAEGQFILSYRNRRLQTNLRDGERIKDAWLDSLVDEKEEEEIKMDRDGVLKKDSVIKSKASQPSSVSSRFESSKSKTYKGDNDRSDSGNKSSNGLDRISGIESLEKEEPSVVNMLYRLIELLREDETPTRAFKRLKSDATPSADDVNMLKGEKEKGQPFSLLKKSKVERKRIGTQKYGTQAGVADDDIKGEGQHKARGKRGLWTRDYLDDVKEKEEGVEKEKGGTDKEEDDINMNRTTEDVQKAKERAQYQRRKIVKGHKMNEASRVVFDEITSICNMLIMTGVHNIYLMTREDVLSLLRSQSFSLGSRPAVSTNGLNNSSVLEERGALGQGGRLWQFRWRNQPSSDISPSPSPVSSLLASSSSSSSLSSSQSETSGPYTSNHIISWVKMGYISKDNAADVREVLISNDPIDGVWRDCMETFDGRELDDDKININVRGSASGARDTDNQTSDSDDDTEERIGGGGLIGDLLNQKKEKKEKEGTEDESDDEGDGFDQ